MSWISTGLRTIKRRFAMEMQPTISRSKNFTPRVSFDLPRKSITEIFPGIENTEARLLMRHVALWHEWSLPFPELLTLAAICRYMQPQTLFEFGTFAGSSTLAIAMNSPETAKIFTIDLDSTARDSKTGLAFPLGVNYRDTPCEKKIHQFVGDARTFDYAPYANGIDLVFIDADHTYDFVKLDSQNAFKVLRRGGVIVWDDYLWSKEKNPDCAGVTRCLDELGRTKKIFHITGTRMAVFRNSIDPSEV